MNEELTNNMDNEVNLLKKEVKDLSEQLKLQNNVVGSLKEYFNIDQIVSLKKDLEEKTSICSALQNYINIVDVKLSVLQHIGKEVGSGTDLDKLLDSLMDTVISAMKVEAGSLLLLNEEKGILEFKVAKGAKSEQIKKFKFRLGEGVVGWVAEKGIPKIIPDGNEENTVTKEIDKETQFKTEHILCVPMKVKDKVIGVIELLNKINRRRFIKEDLDLLISLAGQVALVIDNARLFVNSQEKIKELSTLIEISSILNSTLRLDKILTNVMESTAVMLNAEASSIFLIDEEKKELYFEVATGHAGETVKQIRIPIGEGVAGWVAKEGKSLLVENAQQDSRFYKAVDEVSKFITKSIIAVPLKVKNKTIGVVEVLNKVTEESFSKSDMELLEALASQAAVAIDNAMTHQDLHDLFVNAIRSLAVAVESKDPYTGGHIDRIAYYSLAIASELGWSGANKERVQYAALFHDLGKISVKDEILNKPGKLTDEEFEILKKHPIIAANILKPIHQFNNVIPGILHHHERWDGKGYPFGLKGEEISLDGRIITVVDTFDAMTSDRPYRKGLPDEVAIEEIKKGSGTQFDPKIVELFILAYKKGMIQSVHSAGYDAKEVESKIFKVEA